MKPRAAAAGGLLRRVRRILPVRRFILFAFVALAVTSCVRPRTEGLLAPGPGAYAAAESEVSLPGGVAGATVEGYLVRPRAEGPFPCAVLLHGKGGWWQAYIRYSRELAARGVASLIVNYYSVHTVDLEGLHTPFEERRQQFDLQNRDIVRAASAFARGPLCAGKRVALIGFSLGADKAIRAAAELEEVRAVVGYYGPYDYVTFIKHRVNPVILALATDNLLKWKRYLEENSPVRLAGRVRVPVLLFHGARDNLIPPRQSFAMAASLRRNAGGSARIKLYEGVGHNFVLRRANGLERADSLRLVLDFLRENLPAAAGAARARTNAPRGG